MPAARSGGHWPRAFGVRVRGDKKDWQTTRFRAWSDESAARQKSHGRR